MTINPPYSGSSTANAIPSHEKYTIRNVYFLPDFDPSSAESLRHYEAADTVGYKGIIILYGQKKYLRPGVLYENCFIRPAGIIGKAKLTALIRHCHDSAF